MFLLHLLQGHSCGVLRCHSCAVVDDDKIDVLDECAYFIHTIVGYIILDDNSILWLFLL